MLRAVAAAAVVASVVAIDAPARVDRGAVAAAEETLRIDSQADFDYVDPALSFFSHSWQMHHATCLRVVSYPDANAPEGSKLIPEAAKAMPKISSNGRTYTFTLRDRLRFSPPSNERINAQTFKWTIERALHPEMQSPADSYYDDIVGAKEYMSGQAQEITGIVAAARKLKITLEARKGDFLARLALPFACAVPRDTPIDPVGAGASLPSAGPYDLVEWNKGVSAVAVRNPNYRGPRESNFERIQWTFGPTCASQVARVEAGLSDQACVPLSERPRLREAYGPGTPRQRYFAEPMPVLWYIVLNTERAAFAQKKLRQAVAYALSRTELTARHGFDGGVATDQILPSPLAGYRDDDVFPLNGDLDKAKELAAELGISPENPIGVVMYTFDSPVGLAVADYVQTRLAPVGINVSIQVFSRVEQHTRIATRGEPFDVSIEGWGIGYNDPYDVLDVLLNGSRIRDTNNTNVSYFDDPEFNARLDAASRLTGAGRYPTYADLDRDLSGVAPIVPYINTNRVLFFSDRIGCHVFTPVTGIALNALCIRP